jgi:hypothetical protein
MPARQKLALFSVFAVSYVAVALGAMRAYSSYRLFFVTYDVTWAACDVWLWYVCSQLNVFDFPIKGYVLILRATGLSSKSTSAPPAQTPLRSKHSTRITLGAATPRARTRRRFGANFSHRGGTRAGICPSRIPRNKARL